MLPRIERAGGGGGEPVILEALELLTGWTGVGGSVPKWMFDPNTDLIYAWGHVSADATATTFVADVSGNFFPERKFWWAVPFGGSLEAPASIESLSWSGGGTLELPNATIADGDQVSFSIVTYGVED
jgi:hypothetical protein